MKFSHSIQFNAVPDWSSYYIAYSSLKKQIYNLEKQKIQEQHAGEDTESSTLISEQVNPDDVFRRFLSHEFYKITNFYLNKEKEVFKELDQLLNDVEVYEKDHENEMDGSSIMDGVRDGRRRSVGDQLSTIGLSNKRTMEPDHTLDDSDEDSDDAEEGGTTRTTLLKRPKKTRSRSSTFARSLYSQASQSDPNLHSRRHSVAELDEHQRHEHARMALYGRQLSLGKRIISMFVTLRELKSYVQLNRTGFAKALKKYDKILERDLRSGYLENVVNQAYPFLRSTMDNLDSKISLVEHMYARVATHGDTDVARRELRLHLREHVVWERNTVWREMIGLERKVQAANMGLRRTLLGGDADAEDGRLQGDELEVKEKKAIHTLVGTFVVPKWLFSISFFVLLGCIGIFTALLWIPIMKTPEQQNCLAMLVFVSLLWATEVIPLFVTSLLIPFLVVLLGIVRSDEKPHHRLSPKDAARYIFAAMWTPVIMLLLGGFAIAAALSKYHIAKRMATFVLSKAGTKPHVVLVTNMFVAMFLSMWISNVAAPVLCYSILQPLLRNLPSDSNFSKAVILGIALASNIGGMASPIASPQNIIAIQNMKPAPNWLEWFFIAIPVCIISILLIWLLLIISFRPGRNTTIMPIKPVKDKFTGVQYFVTVVTLVTIGLWCISHQMEHIFGDMGVVAIIPLVLFFGTGILTKEDFNNFLWTIIILAAGGLSLGKAVSSSGLLHTIANSVKNEVGGMSLYEVLITFAGLVLVIATFISHTVAALIFLPLVAQVGASMSQPHPSLLVMGSALMCSAAMGLPTSGFPNMTAIMMEDQHTGKRFLRVKHFISRGIPSSILTFVVVNTVGYALMRIVGL